MTPDIPLHHAVELRPVGDQLAGMADFLDPAAMPDQYAMLIENAFPRKGVEAGDAILVDRLAISCGDVVLVYLRPDRVPDGLPHRLVAELATNVPPKMAPGSEVRPLLGLYIDDEGERAIFLRMDDVLAVHRVYARKRDLY